MFEIPKYKLKKLSYVNKERGLMSVNDARLRRGHEFYGWKTGLFQCCKSPRICCLVAVCPCIGYGNIVGDLPEGSMCCAGNAVGASASFFGLIILESFFSALKTRGGISNAVVGSLGESSAELGEAYLVGRSRELLRQKFHIQKPPNDCLHSDFFLGCCCAQCAMCQELREIEFRKEKRSTRQFNKAPELVEMTM